MQSIMNKGTKTRNTVFRCATLCYGKLILPQWLFDWVKNSLCRGVGIESVFILCGRTVTKLARQSYFK